MGAEGNGGGVEAAQGMEAVNELELDLKLLKRAKDIDYLEEAEKDMTENLRWKISSRVSKLECIQYGDPYRDWAANRRDLRVRIAAVRALRNQLAVLRQ